MHAHPSGIHDALAPQRASCAAAKEHELRHLWVSAHCLQHDPDLERHAAHDGEREIPACGRKRRAVEAPFRVLIIIRYRRAVQIRVKQHSAAARRSLLCLPVDRIATVFVGIARHKFKS